MDDERYIEALGKSIHLVFKRKDARIPNCVPLKQGDEVEAHPQFSKKLVADMDAILGRKYTTYLYNKAIERYRSVADKMLSDWKQESLKRSTLRKSALEKSICRLERMGSSMKPLIELLRK